MAKICNEKRWSRLAPCCSSNWVESECLDSKGVTVLLPVQPGTRVAVTRKGLPYAARRKLLSSAPLLGLQEQNKPQSLNPSQPQRVGGWLYTPETDLLCVRLSGCDRDNQRPGGQTEPVCGPFTQSPIPFPPGKEHL